MVQSIAPGYTYRYPVDINITIYSDDDEYEAIILPTGMGPQSFSIELTHHQVEEINATLRLAIEEVSRNCDENDGISSKALWQLANAGQSAFNIIFENGTAILHRALELIRRGRKPITIEISSKSFFIPWELLYDGPLDEIDLACFWGMQFIISRKIIQKPSPGALVSPIMRSTCPIVGLIVCNKDELENVAKKEIPILQALFGANLAPLRPLDASQHHQELEYFGHFLFLREEELHIAHFACHAVKKNLATQSYLDIANDFRITIDDFRARKFRSKYHPLVILNACLTGITDSLSLSGWASEFWKSGARGVLATEFQVPDWFAPIFIEELYRHLLSSKPIGESLWATRYHFWKKYCNPLGLAYALYSPLAVRIVK